MMIGAYKGQSAVSRAIKFFTWSDYSHISAIDEDDSVTEAWMNGGVRNEPHYCVGHTPGTQIDLFRIRSLTRGEADGMREFLSWQIGKGYDFVGVSRFLTRRNPQEVIDERHVGKWFCSVLLFCVALHVKRHLLSRISPHKVSPGLLVYSPELEFVRTLTTWRMSHESAPIYRRHPARESFVQ